MEKEKRIDAEKIRLLREFVLLVGALIAVFQLIFSNEARRQDWLEAKTAIQEIRQEINAAPVNEQTWKTMKGEIR